jgi:nicotinamide mononucleotide adenylyltransferase
LVNLGAVVGSSLLMVGQVVVGEADEKRDQETHDMVMNEFEMIKKALRIANEERVLIRKALKLAAEEKDELKEIIKGLKVEG